MVRISAAVTFSLFVGAAASSGGPPVAARGVPLGEFSYPDDIVIDGPRTFTPEQIREALFWNTDVLLASHPESDRGRLLGTARQKLLSGYRYLGFPDAKVTSWYDEESKWVMIHVAEGPRYLAGEIRVTGNRAVVAEEIIRHVSESERAWTSSAEEGKPRPRSDKATLDAVAEAVREAYAESGYLYPRFDASIVPEEGKEVAHLSIDVQDEGPLCTADSIEVSGCKRNSPEEVIEHLGLRTGERLTAGLIEKVEDKLRESARFLSHKVTAEPLDQPGDKMNLHIELAEYGKASPLSKGLSVEEEAFLKLLDWTDNFFSGREDLVYAGTDPWTFKVVYSPRRGVIAWLSGLPEFGIEEEVSVVCALDGLAVTLPGRAMKCVVPESNIQLATTIQMVPNPDSESGQNFMLQCGFGIGGRKEGEEPVKLALQMEPVYFVGLAHLEGAAFALDERTLTMTREDEESHLRMKLDRETGRLLELVLTDPRTGEKTGELSFEAEAFEKHLKALEEGSAGYRDCYKSDRWFVPLVGMAARVMIAERLLKGGAPEERERAAAEIGKVIVDGFIGPLEELLQGEAPGPQADRESFVIPMTTAGGKGLSSLTQLFFPLTWRVSMEFPPGSWPRIVAREAGLVASGRTEFLRKDLVRLYRSEEVGPVGYLVVVTALNFLDERLAFGFADRGVMDLSLAGFRKDYHLLLESEGCRELLDRAVESMRELDLESVRVLARLLPPADGEVLNRFVDALNERKDATASEILAEMLDEWWVSSLERHVRAAYAPTYVARGKAYRSLGAHDQAVAEFTKAIELDPDSAEAYRNRGLGYVGKGDHVRASADYRKAIELDPEGETGRQAEKELRELEKKSR